MSGRDRFVTFSVVNVHGHGREIHSNRNTMATARQLVALAPRTIAELRVEPSLPDMAGILCLSSILCFSLFLVHHVCSQSVLAAFDKRCPSVAHAVFKHENPPYLRNTVQLLLVVTNKRCRTSFEPFVEIELHGDETAFATPVLPRVGAVHVGLELLSGIVSKEAQPLVQSDDLHAVKLLGDKPLDTIPHLACHFGVIDHAPVVVADILDHLLSTATHVDKSSAVPFAFCPCNHLLTFRRGQHMVENEHERLVCMSCCALWNVHLCCSNRGVV